MPQARAPAATLASLPREVATAILRHVPLKQRLGPCARACRALAAAAAAATDEVEVQLSDSQQRADALSDWLVANGAHVVRLVLRGDAHLEVRLALQRMRQLQELAVWGPQLKVAAPSTSASPPQGLTRLSRLRVSGSSIVSACASLQPLSALSGLHQLSVEDLSGWRQEQQQQQQQQQEEQQALGQLLAHATQLTQLMITGEVQAAALAGLSALDQLQELQLLTEVSGSTAAWLPALPGGLTRLHVFCLDCSSSAADGLSQLTALQVLELCAARQLRPALLSSLVGLRHLDLSLASLAGGRRREGGGAAGLLAALVRLTQLEELQLQRVLGWLPPAPAEQYAALTASSQLTALELAWCELPAGAAQHMFGQPGRMLPRLVRLDMHPPEAAPSEQRPFRQAGLDSLVACCPGLKQLNLLNAVAAGVQLAPLARLSALTQLCLGGSGAVSSSTATQLAACAGLRSLCVSKVPGLCDAAVLSLTHLRQLTQLGLYGCGLSQRLRNRAGAVPEPRDTLTIIVQAGAGEPPDVWHQLRERCRHSPACASAILREADEQLEAQAAQLKAQAQQLDAQAGRLAQLERLVAQLERLVAQLQAPPAATR